MPDLPTIYIEQLVAAVQTDSATEAAFTQSTWSTQHPAEAEPIDVALARHRHLWIEASGGGGKSTLLRYLALTSLGDPASPWLPLLVSASRLDVPDQPLLSLLLSAAEVEVVDRLGVRALPERFLDEAPSPGLTWLVLVDGLDSISSDERRQSLMTKLATVADDTSSFRFVVTGRPSIATDRPPVPAGFARYRLLPLAPDDLAEFAQRWFSDDDSKSTEAQDFLRRIRETNLDEIARLPLLLTLAAIHYQNDRNRPLPVRRVDLYERLVEVLLFGEPAANAERRGGSSTAEGFAATWATRHPQGRDMAMCIWAQRQPVLEALAWSAVVPPAPDDSSHDPLLEKAVRDLLPPTVPMMKGHLRLPDWLPEDWLRKQVRQLMLGTGLMAIDGGRLAFIHSSVRDYLAASYLTRLDGPDGQLAALVVTNSWWLQGPFRELARFSCAIWQKMGRDDVLDVLVTYIRYISNNHENSWKVGFVLDFVRIIENDGAVIRSSHWAALRTAALPVLMEVAGEPTMDVWIRWLVLDWLEKFDAVVELTSLLSNRRAPGDTCTRAAAWLVDHGHPAPALDFLVTTARHGTDSLSRLHAAETLIEYGVDQDRQLAIVTLCGIAEDPDSATGATLRLRAARALLKYGAGHERQVAIATLRAIAADPAVEALWRDEATRCLALAAEDDPSLHPNGLGGQIHDEA